MSDNTQKLAWMVGLAAGLIAIYNWLENSQCNTPGSTLYGGTVCGWIGLNAPTTVTAASGLTNTSPAAASVASAFPMTSAALQAASGTILSASEVGDIQEAMATALTKLTASNATAAQIQAQDSQMASNIAQSVTAYQACMANKGSWNINAGTCGSPQGIAPAPTVASSTPSNPYGTYGNAATLAQAVEHGDQQAIALMVQLGLSPSSSSAAPAGSLGSQILALAEVPSTQLYNFDQWNYYYNEILAQRGQPPVPGPTFDALLKSQGFTEPSPAVSLQTFLNALNSQGLSGLDAIRAFWVPASEIHNAGVFA